MRFPSLPAAFASALLLLVSCDGPAPASRDLYRAPLLPSEVDGVRWEAGNWEPHLPAGEAGVSWGNHRAVVVAEEASDAVFATIPWRRRDPDPGSRGIIVVDAATDTPVRNALAVRVENTSGDIIFQPNPGSSIYHVYYLPWQSTGGYYPSITYPTPAQLVDPGAWRGSAGPSPSRADREQAARQSWEGKVTLNDPAWERRVRALPLADLPRARTTRIQSVSDFHSFFPMEVIAAPWEEEAFLAGAESGWRLVAEHRDRPVRMGRFLPYHWARPERVIPGSGEAAGIGGLGESVSAGTRPPFASRVLKDEAFTWQVAVISGDGPLEDVTVTFQGFPSTWETTLTCFNCGGMDEMGIPFTRDLDLPPGTVQPLWVGVLIPENQKPGPVEGTVLVSSSNRGSQSLPVILEVQNVRAVNHGFDEPELQGRLFWLNSTLGEDSDFIIEPFEPVTIEGAPGSSVGGSESPRLLSILGRKVALGPLGLPDQIYSFFTPGLTELAAEPDPILARPLGLEVKLRAEGEVGLETGPHVIEGFRAAPFTVEQASRGRARWTAESTSDHFDMTVEGSLEYDGMLDVRITLTARTDVSVLDIALPVSLVPDAARYMLGLGRKGGRRPASIDWKWAVENHQEGLWLGGVHKGLQWVLRDENYVRPLNTNFYRNQPLNLPPSWYNEGRGGIRLFDEREGTHGEAGETMAAPEADPDRAGTPTAVTARNYSGPRTLAAGEPLHFNVRFLITPFKPIDTRTHFDTRFVHMYVPVDSVAAWGGTVVNVHHANEINPFINYPFFNLERQKSYVDEAHEKGIKVKLYNTIRELTYKAHELFALRSLGGEILNDGEGGGHSWMQEHLEDRYHAAWHAWRVDDAAMLNKGTSRWTNYYIEGLGWLAEHQEIDGLYLDDIAFSRETVKRLVNVLHRRRPEVVIDLHSANQFNVRDGFINSAFLYMEHFPFISRLWFGEYFEYGLGEDYWLTEVSGLPFGLMGEMLQDGGHPYRGMLYGMTARMYGSVDPRPVWSMMSRFDIAESRMLGYWLEDAPVATDHPRVLATAYARPEATLVALASWSDQDEVVGLDVDWERLGWDGPEVFEAVREDGGSPSPGSLAGFRAYAPAVAGLQTESDLDLSAVPVPAGMGLFILLEKDARAQAGIAG